MKQPATTAADPAFKIDGLPLTPEMLLVLVNGQICQINLTELTSTPVFCLKLEETAKALGGISERTVQRLADPKRPGGPLLHPLTAISRPLLFPVMEILRFIREDLAKLDPSAWDREAA